MWLLSAGMVLWGATDLQAQTAPPEDQALGALIAEITNRDSSGLTSQASPVGGDYVDLKGRFQQAVLGQLLGEGPAGAACVTSVAEANIFFGRDLRTGAPLSDEASEAHDELVAEALRHGMAPAEYQFYIDLIEASGPMSPAASTITIVNNDGPGEGFNSTAAQLLPAPGNDTNANLGEQRLALFNAAAQVWSNFLDSSVTIQVRSQFDPLTPCSPAGGVLGQAGTLTAHRNFTNAEFTNTWYHQALANKRAGSDLSGNPDISATFNSDVDTGCLGGGSHFYYGLDNATPPLTINLFIVLLHEMGHGLGFSNFTSQSGALLNGAPDVWSRLLYDDTLGLYWIQMNNAQRAASSTNTNNLYWDGANVRQASGFLTNGRDATTGRVRMYAPNPYEGGSSVSHWAATASPNLLMEPFINTGLPLTLDLTRQQMRDIGWYRDTTADLVPDTITSVLPSGSHVVQGSSQNITWTNNGGFNRNVTIELSMDGGSTFPTVVASNIANTGSYLWSVPNSPTASARLRVREHDFLSPLGQSAASFSIGPPNTPPSYTPAGAIGRQQGSPAPAPVAVGTVTDTETPDGNLLVTQIAGGTATGITVSNITNNNGSVSAVIQASCTATSGTVRFEVSDGDLEDADNLQINVSANTAPQLTYLNAAVDSGDGTLVNPNTGPSDNGSIGGISVQSTGTYGGGISVNPAGVVTIANATPIGTHTITIRATDNCGAHTDAQFQLQVTNTAPAFSPEPALMRQQGTAPGSAVAVGIASDNDTAAGDLVVTQIAGGTATGIVVGGISNNSGFISAMVSASCTATSGTVRFQASDGDLTGFGDLQVDVIANSPPVLSYANTSVDSAAGIMHDPQSGPSDNGLVTGVALQSTGSYTGDSSVNPGGTVSFANAAPIGTHTITVRATDNCGAFSDAPFELQVNNTAPEFFPAAGVHQQQGSPPGAPVGVGTVEDDDTVAGDLVVSQIAGGTAAGVTASDITNTNGAVSATIAASCTATTGTLRFEVSDGDLSGTGDFSVQVTANTPPMLSYANAMVDEGASVPVNPATGPSDNGTVDTVSVQDTGTYTGSISVSPGGVVSISNAAPRGTHTITIRATDDCGEHSDAQFELQVNNVAPTFTPAAAIDRQQGSPSPGPANVGTVFDPGTAADDLVVTQVAGGTASGITVTSITNPLGALITASVVAECTAVSGTVRFQVSDGDLQGTGDVQVNVSPNSPPVLSYANDNVDSGSATMINPLTGPLDNGSVDQIVVQDAGSYTGSISVGPAGVVSLSNAAPLGTHTITIRATDNCGEHTDAQFQLTVNNTAPVFSPGSALLRQQGSPGGAPVGLGTASDDDTPPGDLVITEIAGGTATGIILSEVMNAAGAVTGVVAAGCSATSGTIRIEASDGDLSGFGDLQVDVTANTPPVLSYANNTVDAGGSVPVNPATGLSDNGSVDQIEVHDQGSYTGGISVNPAGVVSISSAAPAGLHTITIRATDNCGAHTDASFELQVGNTPPTFTPGGALERQQGSGAGPAVTVGTVSDVGTDPGSLVVTRIPGGTATGISVSGITNSAGTISAALAASCSATSGTVRFNVSDGKLDGFGDVQVNVIANAPPQVGQYPATALSEGAGITVSPASLPTDNGSVDNIEASVAPASYTGTAMASLPSGDVELFAAAPLGVYTVTVELTDNCGATAQEQFELEVYILGSGFETP